MPNDNDNIRDVVSHAVRETLLQLGFDTNDPKRLQADMAHLRYWRETMEEITSRSIIGGLIFIVVSMLGMVGLGFQAILGKG